MGEAKIKNPILLAVRKNPGLATSIGKACGLSRSAVWMWKRIPAEHALAVAKFMNVSPHVVRPDLYPRDILRQLLSAAE